MGCVEVKNGLDVSCGIFPKKYFQQFVLVNRKDVQNYSIQTKKYISTTETECRHRLYFTLKDGKSGKRFVANEKGFSIFGSYTKSEDNSRNEYSHKVQMLMMGLSEEQKCLLRELDSGDYFIALQAQDDTIEIYGFEYGLTTNSYTYDIQAGRGGGLVELVSNQDALEDEPPFIYKSMDGDENEDFNNNFDSNPPIELGDFNEDFNTDFYVTNL